MKITITQSGGFAITTVGLREVRKAMKECELDLKDLTRMHKKLSEIAAEDIRGAVPGKGTWRKAIKGAGTRQHAKVIWGRDSVPYAPWIEFGGTVAWKARGGMHPVNIAKHGIVRTVLYMSIKRPRVAEGRYVYPTAERNAEKYLKVYTDLLDETLRRNGFR